jgi:hypothetical protein
MGDVMPFQDSETSMKSWARSTAGLYKEAAEELVSYVEYAKNELGWTRDQTRGNLLLEAIPSAQIEGALAEVWGS